MADHTIRPTTPQLTSVPSSLAVPAQVPPSGGSSVRPPIPLGSGRNAGASSPPPRRLSLSALPGKVLQTVMDQAATASRAALARTGQAMAAHVAIHSADAAVAFAQAAGKVALLVGRERAEAALALADRFPTRIGHLPLAEVLPVYQTMTDLLKGLPATADFTDTAHGIGRSMLKATERAVDWMLHAPAHHSEVRDALDFGIASSLKDMAGLLRTHGVVHDEPAMNDMLDHMMGPQGSLLSAQVALSELPQHALDLPKTPEGNAQTVRMMTKLAKDATADAGLAALKCDPSWGPFLADERIGIILERKGIDLADHPELQTAMDQLSEKANALREKVSELAKSAI